MTAAIITVSDKGSRGERTDLSGPALADMLTGNGWTIAYTVIVPDERTDIKAELIRCSDELKIDFIITTGGTGFTKRDTTPEATLEVLERVAPGIAEHMRAESAKVTPSGILSRGVSGLRGDSLIVNVPGSVKAAKECLGFVLPAVEHAIIMLQSDATEH
jgi:molybdenum cofactor synthesis domain-containing protein